MKKNILSALTVGVLFVSTSVFAQITVGPKIGYNLSSIKEKVITSGTGFSNNGDIKNNSGFNVGAMMNAQMGKYFSIRPELLYNQAGFKYTSTDTYGNSITTSDYTANYSYLSIPVNFVGHLPLGDNFKIQGIIGLTTSFGLGGKLKTTVSNGSSSASNNTNIKMKKDPDVVGDDTYYLNGLDMGINYGIGCQYKAFVFSAVYNMGVSNTESHYSNQKYEDKRGADYKQYNKSMSFSVAYLFGGK